jgi:hypothetical protein
MKPILVIWQEALTTFVYSFPYYEILLNAHGAFIGSIDNTTEQEIAVNTVRLLVQKGTPLPPHDPIVADLYSNIIICGILEEV